MMERPGVVSIVGGGPAGCAAALTALASGVRATIYEKSRFPRHKVCGEFLSPEAGIALERHGLWPALVEARPARLSKVILHFDKRHKSFVLEEPAYSLSRYTLDGLLLNAAVERGAELKCESVSSGCDGRLDRLVVAHGRQSPTRKGRRLFGFKAHYRGPGDDTLQMFFFRGCYVGVSAVEGGIVNVCGLAPEELLRQNGFQPDALFCDALNVELHALDRMFEWLVTGPLVFRDSFNDRADAYLAGDAMGFVDPFTGSGILAALLTGAMAGDAAAKGTSVREHTRACRRVLARQYSVASILRSLLGVGLAESLAPMVPGAWLYRLTRPMF